MILKESREAIIERIKDALNRNDIECFDILMIKLNKFDQDKKSEVIKN